jgi:hypothetical protein
VHDGIKELEFGEKIKKEITDKLDKLYDYDSLYTRTDIQSDIKDKFESQLADKCTDEVFKAKDLNMRDNFLQFNINFNDCMANSSKDLDYGKLADDYHKIFSGMTKCFKHVWNETKEDEFMDGVDKCTEDF